MKELLLLVMCLYSFNSNYAHGSGFGFSKTRQVDPEVIDLLEKLQKDLKLSPSTERLDCGSNPTAKCDFMLMCNKLRSNKNAKALYQNSSGQFIPNYKLLYLIDKVDHCRNNVSATPTILENPFALQQKNYLKKRAAFLESIQSHNEETKIIKLEQAMLDASIESANDPKFNPFFVKRDQIEKNISNAEAKTGVKLSNESRTKWIESLDLIQNINYQSKPSSSDNPFIKIELLTNIGVAGSKQKVQEYQAQFQRELNRSFDIFKDTKSQLIAILDKRKNEKNSDGIMNMIGRINKIKMNPPEILAGMMNMSSCSSPNAFYDPTSHTFTLCPQLLQMPSAAIQTIIAHELGHSIDPCTATFSFEKINGTQKPNPYTDSKESEKDQQEMAEQMGMIPFKPSLPDQGQEKYSAFDSDSIKLFMEKDYDNLSFTEQQHSIPLSKNPFLTVVNCLQGSDSVGARIGDIETAKNAVQQKISDLVQSGATKNDPTLKDLEQTLQRIDSVYTEQKACSFMGSKEGHSQIQEAFSDWIAAEVTANKVAAVTDEQTKQQIAFESNGFFAAMSCRSFDLDIAETAKNILKKAKCISDGSNFLKDLGNMHAHDDPHPENYSRINKIFMAHPTIAGALSCQKESEVKHCE